ncbi:uncharacterized protein LOC143917658 [Arctopsyche grandis]|uniref:uncharacterized protein LOC143917658 n=1 Tax=Arctopsyche grandis TaxID=121162 RepID=UPI00406D6AF2
MAIPFKKLLHFYATIKNAIPVPVSSDGSTRLTSKPCLHKPTGNMDTNKQISLTKQRHKLTKHVDRKLSFIRTKRRVYLKASVVTGQERQSLVVTPRVSTPRHSALSTLDSQFSTLEPNKYDTYNIHITATCHLRSNPCENSRNYKGVRFANRKPFQDQAANCRVPNRGMGRKMYAVL